MFFSCMLGYYETDFESDVASPSSVEFARRLKTGWNLGNTLDAHKGDRQGVTEAETCRNMPVTQQWMIQDVKKAGFQTIRIPVTWHTHVDSNFIIDEEWMARVQQLVDWSIGEGFYAIIDIHHDNLNEEDVRAGKPGFCLSHDFTLQSKSIKFLTAIWTQVAERFKDYDNRLIFEVLNEPRRKDDFEEWWFLYPPDAKIWNSYISTYEKHCIQAIRATGGNNRERFIMCPEYAASPNYLEYYTLPPDTAHDKLLISVHGYVSYQFCSDKASYTDFTSADEAEVSIMFSNLQQRITSKGVGVVMGETGTSDKLNDDEREKWARSFYSKAKAANISVLLWDNKSTVSIGRDINSCDCFGFYKRKNKEWVKGSGKEVEIQGRDRWFFPDLVHVMMESYGN